MGYNKIMNKKVVLGFSGGVDSALAAVLLKNAGYEVLGLYLDNADEAALEAAIRGAEFSGIPLTVADVKAELEEKVCSAFARSYLMGETPNPCILCNPCLKFRNLLETAQKLGADHIATGHYARAVDGALYKGHPENDQSYMLCRLSRDQLNALLLPLGEFPKSKTREMAQELGLPAAGKPDSMEICFIPDKDYIGWLGRRAELPGEGDLVFHGETIGRHRGHLCYTVGQRYPGLIDDRKVYISRKDAARNVIELALWEELFTTEVRARDFNWLCDMPDEFRGTVRVRHTKWENPPCTVRRDGDGIAIICDEPVRAPAAGQSAVIYVEDRVIGGGFICA